MNIVLNGKPKEVSETTVPADLMRELKFDAESTSMWINGRHLRVSEYETASLAEGDQLKIIPLIGGGC